MNSHRIQVFCDFDGTITRGDTVDLLLETLARDEWREIEERWENGEISSRECMSRQIPLIRGGWAAIEKVLQTVEVDKSLGAFVAWCRQKKITFSIVSDGLDRVIDYLLRRENIEVDGIWSNRLVDEVDGSLSLHFPERKWPQECNSGQCKCQILDRAPLATLKVVIGDGRSDFCWARAADVLFAKDKLRTFCLSEGIACTPFNSLVEVRVALEEHMTSTTMVPMENLLGTPLLAGA